MWADPRHTEQDPFELQRRDVSAVQLQLTIAAALACKTCA